MADGPSSGSGRMEGHGFYTAHSQAQQAFGELAMGWLEQATAEVGPPSDGLPFVIADLGAAGGGSSLEPMRRALAARANEGPALVVHTDIPSNDFSSLFELLQTSPASYLGAPGVFALAAGRSFYERLFPDGYLSLGWSSIAVHWLSRLDSPIPDHIYSTFAVGDIRRDLQHQSARDWNAFLDNRAAELRPSGRLVIVGGANTDDGLSGAEGLMDFANTSLRALVTAGVIRDSEYRRMTIPTWNRTQAEFIEPFRSGAMAGRLTLLRHELRSLSDPYFAEYQSSGDLDCYTADVVGFFRAAFDQSLWAALDSDRDPTTREAIQRAFGAELGDVVAADPEQAACSWRVVILDIAR